MRTSHVLCGAAILLNTAAYASDCGVKVLYELAGALELTGNGTALDQVARLNGIALKIRDNTDYTFEMCLRLEDAEDGFPNDVCGDFDTEDWR